MYFVLGKLPMKYTVKLLLRETDPNTQGLFPVYLRVTISRDRKYIATGIFLQKKHWDEKAEQIKAGHPMHQVYNPDLTDRKQRVIRLIVERNLKGQATTAAQVKAIFTGTADLHNIFEFIDEYRKDVQHKRKAGTLENYAKYSRKLELFQGSRILAFEEIDIAYLQRYENSLRAEGLDGNYIFANFKMLRTFFNAARRRQIITCYPFANYENPVYRVKGKEYLTLPELDRWEQYADTVKDLTGRQTAVYFLLGSYTGLRLSDWLQFDINKHVVDNIFLIRAEKNNEWITMPITARLRRTLNRVARTPLTITEQEMNRTLKNIAKDKKVKISKKLSTHCARGTFAVTMCANQGIGVEVCAKLMGISIKVCADAYYRVTNKKIENEVIKAWGELT